MTDDDFFRFDGTDGTLKSRGEPSRATGEEAIRSAKPKGGIVPEGIAGANEGREEDDTPTKPAPCGTPRTPAKIVQPKRATWDLRSNALMDLFLAAAAALMLAGVRGSLLQDMH